MKFAFGKSSSSPGWRAIVIVLVVGLLIAIGVPVANAATETGPAIKAVLVDSKHILIGSGFGPSASVEVTARSNTHSFSAVVIADASGRFEIPLPGPNPVTELTRVSARVMAKQAPASAVPSPSPSAGPSTAPVAGALAVSPQGSDSNAGTAGAPFKTFSKALSMATAGSTIYVRGGEYTEKVVVKKSGSPGKPITIAAYPGEKPAINGGTASYYGESVVMLKAVHDVVVQGLEVRNMGGDGAGITVVDSSNVTIKGNLVHDIQHVGIDVSGNGITVDGNEIYNACLTNSKSAYGTGGWPPALTTKRLTSGASSSNIDITNNYVHDSWGEGIDAWFLNGGTISNNRSINNYSVNLYIDDSKDISVVNNFMQSTNDTHNARGKGRPSAIAISSETGSTKPTNMIINGNQDGGGHSESFSWHDNGIKPITQGPDPQNMP